MIAKLREGFMNPADYRDIKYLDMETTRDLQILVFAGVQRVMLGVGEEHHRLDLPAGWR